MIRTPWDALRRWQGLRPATTPRELARVGFARLAHALGLLRLGLRLVAALDRRGRLVVLAYHKVLPANLLKAGDGVETANFQSQVQVLGELFDLVGPAEGLAARTGSGGRRARYPLLLTFDDGYRNHQRYAFPVLKAAGVPALFFVTTELLGTDGFVWTDEIRELLLGSPLEELALTLGGHTVVHDLHDRPARLTAASRVKNAFKKLPLAEFTARLAELRTRSQVPSVPHDDGTRPLTWDEARQLRDGGMSFGSHSSSHYILSRVPAAALAEDLAASRRRLEDELGWLPRLFAYPNGHADDYDAKVVAAVKMAGFEHAFTMRSGVACDRDGALELPRIAPGDLPGQVVALDLLLLLARDLWRDRRSQRQAGPARADTRTPPQDDRQAA